MAELLKNYIDKDVVNLFATQIAKHDKNFSPSQFKKLVLDSSWSSLELKQRIRRVVTVLGQTVSGNYKTQIQTHRI